ncbi:cell division protein MraZ [Williamsoniiplasma somnilux]|uniref:Transcriptional regulator MraZ n=1 Tax=Williamsoniiplasma somnilux TaxID=215578 RepID=A0A2K8P177_9MOLU|nr:division/cell wall cluster transcriptional repressor MraZ [Williamsoniiplasma somnilux]ATZ18653.1 cell division protein MraZ [Williamsoniiplasma somnilux]
MLLGTFENKLDDKLRLTIPSKMRGQLGNVVFVSKGFECSLEIRSADEYQKWIDSILSLATMSTKARLLQREILGNSAEAEIDSSGRIKIPSNLLTLAGIAKDVFVIGVGSRIELWDKNKYNKYLEANSSELEKVADLLSGYVG